MSFAIRSTVAAAVVGCLAVSTFAQTTQPSSPQETIAHMHALDKQFHALFPKLADLADPATHSAHAAEGATLLKGILADIDALAAAQPQMATQATEAKVPYQALLLTIDDADTEAALAARAAGSDSADAVRARRAQLLSQWYLSGDDAKKQSAVIDSFEPLAKAHPDDVPLTSLMLQLSQSHASPETSRRLTDLVTGTMKNPLVDRYKQQADAEAKMKALEGKPMTIAGKLPDGKPFTTADWKGKVVLVDFWAVWCGPCKAELPRVKKAYTDFHDKGLEVLGVSNDYSAETLTTYASQQAMPWPQLFDAAAAADQTWNPITLGYGINSIPTIFLIDKNGICRSVSARADFETQIPKMLAETPST